jgi:tRNA-Thr(GGU) m(6)t(6)A37 methyltransferase TsaA
VIPALVRTWKETMLSFEITPIGTVRNDRTDIQDTDNWGAVRSTITVDERFGEASLQGLEGFSHVEVLFVFDQFPERDDYREPRPYRGRADLPPVGVFAGRGPRRPNRIGVTCCPIESVHGRELTVRGLDAVCGTPVVDLKPVMVEFLPRDVRQPAWVSPMMAEYFRP